MQPNMPVWPQAHRDAPIFKTKVPMLRYKADRSHSVSISQVNSESFQRSYFDLISIKMKIVNFLIKF